MSINSFSFPTHDSSEESAMSFPLIKTIDDVLPFIDEECFRVVEKDCGNTYINYVKMGTETFPPYTGCAAHDRRAAIRRECRGLAFNTITGKLVSRPFQKFFNIGEREDTSLDVLDFTKPHIVQNKIDGSMVRPIPTDSGIRWGTKMGLTDVGNLAEVFVMANPDYEDFAKTCMRSGCTPLFEFTSPSNRIVVDYGEPAMTLLAIRINLTGEYMPYYDAQDIASMWNIPFVPHFAPVYGDPAEFLEHVRRSTDLGEGIVVWFRDGNAVKLKTDQYVTLHKVKEASRTERTLVAAILDETVDDLLGLLEPEDRRDVDKFITDFWRSLSVLNEDIDYLYNQSREQYGSKKDFALGTTTDLTPLERSQVFAMWDGKVQDSAEAARLIVRSALVSETKWTAMRENIRMATKLNDFTFSWEGDADEW